MTATRVRTIARNVAIGDTVYPGRRPGFVVESSRPASFAGVDEVVLKGTDTDGRPASRVWPADAVVSVIRPTA